MTSVSSPPNSHDTDNVVDPRVDITTRAVDWHALSTLACTLHGVTLAQWGDQLCGGYNLVRYLHLEDQSKTIIVARVPLQPVDGWDPELSSTILSQIASEVATMEYIEEHTNIPIPHIIHHSIEFGDPGVRSPYILMSKVNGVPLSSLWNTMEDQLRDIVLRQVVDIILELASQRFDMIGVLLRRDGIGKNAWYIEPMAGESIDDSIPHRAVSTTTHTNGVEYWTNLMNSNLRDISDNNFGVTGKEFSYSQAWFMCSLVPSLYDTSLDAISFPLLHGDFHSQNIMVTDVESNPRVTAVIDWEFSATVATSTFAQYPLFIVDHPLWDDNHPLHPRNIRDQASFDKFMHEAERKRNPDGGQPLSRVFANCIAVYSFEQALSNPILHAKLFDQLFGLTYGDDEDNFSVYYYRALMRKGVLRKETQQFENETAVWREAFDTLAELNLTRDLSKSAFKTLILEYRDRFAVGGKVREWLASGS
jgi:hypothetical protein